MYPEKRKRRPRQVRIAERKGGRSRAKGRGGNAGACRYRRTNGGDRWGGGGASVKKQKAQVAVTTRALAFRRRMAVHSNKHSPIPVEIVARISEGTASTF